MTCKKYLLLVVGAILVIHSSGFLVSSIQTTMQRFSSSLKTTNWMRVLREVHKTANKLNNFRKNLKIDFSAGCGGISSPHVNDLDNIDDVTYMNEETSMSPVLWAHQVGRSAVQKAPDKALLGGLVLIASELLRRGVNSERYPLPPQIREFANTTSTELEIKLEMLSSLNWKADPFLKQEYENLQAQPLEVLDKFITTSILPSVDKDLTPFLLKSKVDTGKVKLITQSVKDLIKLSMVILQKNTAGQIQVVVPPQMAPSILDQTVSSIDKTASTLIEQVDLVGQGIEGVVNDWNRNVVQFTGSLTEYLNTDTIISLINGQFHTNDGKGKQILERKEDDKNYRIESDSKLLKEIISFDSIRTEK